MFIDDVLIPVKHLINGASIVQMKVNEVTYHHVELPRHDVILAEGLPTKLTWTPAIAPISAKEMWSDCIRTSPSPRGKDWAVRRCW